MHKLRLVDKDRQNVLEICAADDSCPPALADELLSFVNGHKGTLCEFMIDFMRDEAAEDEYGWEYIGALGTLLPILCGSKCALTMRIWYSECQQLS